jgi:hypothetical protein
VPDVKARVLGLAATDPAASRAKRSMSLGASIDQAPTDNIEAARNYFRRFRDEAEFQFFQVDQNLMRQCDELLRLLGPFESPLNIPTSTTDQTDEQAKPQ